MNWVGGARSRIEKKNEKKVQKLFFERKRQEKKFGKISKPSPTKKGYSISQDLLSFHAVMRAHEKNVKQRGRHQHYSKPRHVEIDDLTPCRIQHDTSVLSTSPTAKSCIDFHRVSDENKIDTQKKHITSSDTSQSNCNRDLVSDSGCDLVQKGSKVNLLQDIPNANQHMIRKVNKGLRISLHKNPVATSTPMYPMAQNERNFCHVSFVPGTYPKKHVSKQHMVSSRSPSERKPFDKQEHLFETGKLHKVKNKRASYFNLFKESQSSDSSNDESEEKHSILLVDGSNVKHSFSSEPLPKVPLQIEVEKMDYSDCEKENVNIDVCTKQLSSDLMDSFNLLKSPYNMKQPSANSIEFTCNEQLVPLISKSPVISPCLLPGRFILSPEIDSKLQSRSFDYSGCKNIGSYQDFEKVRIVIDEEEDFNPYKEPGPHAILNLNSHFSDHIGTEKRNCELKTYSFENTSDFIARRSNANSSNVDYDEQEIEKVVKCDWISPKDAEKHIDDLLNDRGCESYKADGFSTSRTPSESSIGNAVNLKEVGTSEKQAVCSSLRSSLSGSSSKSPCMWSTLRVYLNQSFHDLKQYDMLVYEQYLMIKAFLLSSLEVDE